MKRKQRQLGSIPNIEGYEFLAINKDGTMENKIVNKRENGTHYVDGFLNIKYWERLI